MTEAVALLRSGGFTCVLCKGDITYTSSADGVAPMLDFAARGVCLEGFSAADKIVGKAAAMLFVCAGVSAVYAAVMSEAGARTLAAHGIAFEYESLVPYIVNRRGDGMCPMEEAVQDIDEPRAAAEAVRRRRAELMQRNISPTLDN